MDELKKEVVRQYDLLEEIEDRKREIAHLQDLLRKNEEKIKQLIK